MKGKFWCFLILGLVANVALIIGIYLYTRGATMPSLQLKPFSCLKNIYYTETKNGFKSWELVAKQASMPQGQRVHLKTIKVTFFLKNSFPIYLTAEQGKLDLDTRDIKLTGNVHIWQKGGYVFLAPRLYYKNQQQLLFTDAPVKVKGNNITAIAKGMKYFVKEDRLILSQKVKTTFINTHADQAS